MSNNDLPSKEPAILRIIPVKPLFTQVGKRFIYNIIDRADGTVKLWSVPRALHKQILEYIIGYPVIPVYNWWQKICAFLSGLPMLGWFDRFVPKPKTILDEIVGKDFIVTQKMERINGLELPSYELRLADNSSPTVPNQTKILQKDKRE